MTDTTSNPSSGLWLTPAELHELTGYKHAKRQKMALGQMNVPFRSRAADGYPLVDRALFERAPYRIATGGSLGVEQSLGWTFCESSKATRLLAGRP